MCCFIKTTEIFSYKITKAVFSPVYKMGKTEGEFIAGRYRVAILQL